MNCPRCGTTNAPDHQFCKKCGQSLIQAANLPEAGFPETAPPKFLAEKETGLTSSHAASALPVRWLRFWTYIRLPLGIVSAAFVTWTAALPPVLVFLLLLQSILGCVLVVGLHQRRLGAWRLNWLFLGSDLLLYPLSNPAGYPTQNPVGYIVAVILISVIWGWPNYIYFRKRRALFSE